MKKSVKDQTARAFQVGGYNPPSVPQQPYTQPTQVNPQTGTYVLPGTGIAGYQIPTGAPTGFTPYGGATPYFQPVQFTGAQYQTALQTTNLPTFAETVGQRAGQYDELRTYINDAGQTLQIPFKDGRPIYPIPEGYRPIGDQPAPEEQEQTTVTPTLGETTVRDEGGGDRDSGYTVGGVEYGSVQNATKAQEDMYGITGNSGVNVGAIFGVLTGNPLAALASVSGYAGTPSTAFGKEPEPGTGALSAAQLGLANLGVPQTGLGRPGALTQDQIAARMEAMSNLGVTMTGKLGYNPGDAIPGMPGAVMGLNGVARNRDGSIARDRNGVPVYDSIKSFIEYNSLTREEKQAMADREAAIGKANQEYAEAVAESAESGESYSGGTESMADAVAAGRDPTGTSGAFTGQPTGMEDEYDGPASDSSPSSGGFGAGQDSRGDDSDTGRGSGGTGQGSSSDGSAGGPGSGTDGGASSGCFEKGTLFKMADGTTKCVEDIKPGDKMYKGGLVYAVMQGDGLLEDWYDYNGIHVTSGHPVLDNGTWKRVGETSSKKAIDKREIYYSLMNTNHLMIAENGTEFTDFVEISADIGGRGEWMMEMLNQRQAA